jgi:hypothetical protein
MTPEEEFQTILQDIAEAPLKNGRKCDDITLEALQGVLVRLIAYRNKLPRDLQELREAYVELSKVREAYVEPDVPPMPMSPKRIPNLPPHPSAYVGTNITADLPDTYEGNEELFATYDMLLKMLYAVHTDDKILSRG